MQNSSYITTFLLTPYKDIGSTKYLYFCLILFMYSSVILANSLIIGLICAERSLHEPMYVFLCNLCVNELYGSTATYPSLLVNMLSDIHQISRSHCMLQMFSINTYGHIELFSLAIMAYDRYMSVYNPLKYNLIMTPAKVTVFIFLIWMVSIIKTATVVNFIELLPLCGNTVNKVYCNLYPLLKLLCTESINLHVYGLINTSANIGIFLCLILYSYAKIIQTCLRTSKESRKKVLETCTPHLVSLLNFCAAIGFETFENKFEVLYTSPAIKIIISVYFLMISPILSPVIYGVRLPKIRTAFKKTILRKVSPH